MLGLFGVGSESGDRDSRGTYRGTDRGGGDGVRATVYTVALQQSSLSEGPSLEMLAINELTRRAG
jgi:hypothetical protein